MPMDVQHETAMGGQLNWKLFVFEIELNVLLGLAMARNKPALQELNEIIYNNLLAHASEKVGAGHMKPKFLLD